MKIFNKTSNMFLAEEAFVADSLFLRIKGLLGRKDIAGNQALVIKPCNAIHSFFMRFPIDVLFVDGNNRIVAVEKSFKPWRIGKLYTKAKYVVELKSGIIDKALIRVGDEIALL